MRQTSLCLKVAWLGRRERRELAAVGLQVDERRPIEAIEALDQKRRPLMAPPATFSINQRAIPPEVSQLARLRRADVSPYRLRVGENGFPKFWRPITRDKQVNGNAKQVLQLDLSQGGTGYTAKREASSRCRFDSLSIFWSDAAKA
jgi:hypothetical protein